jgi:hypothetical protein
LPGFPGGEAVCENLGMPRKSSEAVRAILTDSHFLIPLIVFFVGLALLIALH